MHPIQLALLAILALLATSCQIATGNRAKGTYLYASVGGDARGLKQTAEGLEAESLETSKSFSTGVKTVGTVVATDIVTDGVTAGQQILQDGMTKRLVATEGTTRAVAAGKEATKRAAIAADVTKATHTP
jgi:hypothetical protein